MIFSRAQLLQLVLANLTVGSTGPTFIANVNALPVTLVPSYYIMPSNFSGTVLTQQWYRNNGSGPVLISGATGIFYIPQAADVGYWLSVRGTTDQGTFSTIEFPAMNSILSNALVGSGFVKHTTGLLSAGYTALLPIRIRASIASADYATATSYQDITVGPGTYSGATLANFSGVPGTPKLSIRDANGTAAVVARVKTRAPKAVRPAYNTGTGFFVLNGAVYNPDGTLFQIRGVNQCHYDGAPAGIYNANANVHRIFMGQNVGWTAGSPGGPWNYPNKVVLDQKLAQNVVPMPTGQSLYITITATFDAATSSMNVSNIALGYIGIGTHIYGIGGTDYSHWYTVVAGPSAGGVGTYTLSNSTNGLTVPTITTPTTLTNLGSRTTTDAHYDFMVKYVQMFIDQAANWTTYNANGMFNIANEWGSVSNGTAVQGTINGTTLQITSGAVSRGGQRLQLSDGTVIAITSWDGTGSTGTGTGGTGTYTIDRSLSYPTNQVMRDCTWREAYKYAITALRNAGYLMPLVIDAPGSGQSVATLIQDGQALQDFDPQHNIVLSYHIYGNGKPGGLDTFLSGLSAVSDSTGTYGGPAIICGEFGPGRDVNAAGGDPTFIHPLEVIATAEGRGWGWLAWAWDDNDLGNASSDDFGYAMVFNNSNGYATSVKADLTTFGTQVLYDPYYGTKFAVPSTLLGGINPGYQKSPTLVGTDIRGITLVNNLNGQGSWFSVLGYGFGTDANIGTSIGAIVQCRDPAGDNQWHSVYSHLSLGTAKTWAWSQLMELQVQVGSLGGSQVDGRALDVRVVVNGTPSNVLTARMINQGPRDFYFASPTGNDATGVKNDPTHPYRYIQNASGGTYLGIWGAWKRGDTIVPRGNAGTWTDQLAACNNRWMQFPFGPAFPVTTGTTPTGAVNTGYYTIYGYPGEDVHGSFNAGGAIHGCDSARAQAGSGNYFQAAQMRFDTQGGAERDAGGINTQSGSDNWQIGCIEFGPWIAGSSAVLNCFGFGGQCSNSEFIDCYSHDVEALSDHQNHNFYFGGVAGGSGYNNATTNTALRYCVGINSGGSNFQWFWQTGVNSAFMTGNSMDHCWAQNSTKYGYNIGDSSVSMNMSNCHAINSGFNAYRICTPSGQVPAVNFEACTAYGWNRSQGTATSVYAIMNEGFATTGAIKFSHCIFMPAARAGAYSVGYYVNNGAGDTTITGVQNLYFDPDGVLTTGWSKDTSPIVGDPKFTNVATYDFTLQAGSAAIDAVTTTPIVTITDDYYGVARFQGVRRDIGACEGIGT